VKIKIVEHYIENIGRYFNKKH